MIYFGSALITRGFSDSSSLEKKWKPDWLSRARQSWYIIDKARAGVRRREKGARTHQKLERISYFAKRGFDETLLYPRHLLQGPFCCCFVCFSSWCRFCSLDAFRSLIFWVLSFSVISKAFFLSSLYFQWLHRKKNYNKWSIYHSTLYFFHRAQKIILTNDGARLENW